MLNIGPNNQPTPDFNRGELSAHTHTQIKTVSISQSQGLDQHDMSNYNLPKIHLPLYTVPVRANRVCGRGGFVLKSPEGKEARDVAEKER